MNNRLPLNAGQQHAADVFFSFLMSDAKEMGIDGPGGVGKSFLMAHLIDEVIPKYRDMCSLMGIPPIYEEIEILAMTNKAAEVLAEATQRPVRTLHSFLNLKVVEDYETGATRVSKTPAWTVHEKKIIFVDEISMQDGPTDNFFMEGTHECKIVYVGDDCQLKPVSGTNPVYQRPMQWVTLTEQMRTGIPEIQALHAQLRETVKTGIFKPIQIVPGIIDWYDPLQMEKAIEQDFAQQTVDKRILCYTNKKVKGLNDFIRDLRQLPPSYTEGEKLINNNALRLGRAMLSTDAEVEIIDIGEPFKVPVEDVHMWVQEATLKSRSGQYYEKVRIPMDRVHYADLIAHFKRTKNWVPYFALKGNYPDLRQRDAGTTYKAQGSTYDRCYIDLEDISNCRNPDQAARLLYVALTRERHHIVLYGQLASKYGGLTL